MTLPSKELLNKVLNIEVLDEICPIYAEGNEIKYYVMHKYVECTAPKVFGINKYELAHKVKEWAWSQGYALNIIMKESHITKKLCYKVIIDPTEYAEYSLVSDAEPETIFEAGEWILKGLSNG